MESNNSLSKEFDLKSHEHYIFLFEILGTGLFTYAIGCSHQNLIGSSQNFIHCFSLLLPLALAGQVSGGYFNSTITLAAFFNKKHQILRVYLLAQFLGGALGTIWYWLITGRVIAGYEHESNLEMAKFIINQIVGSFLLSVCILALTSKFTTHAYKSWQIYISIAASLYLIRKMTDDTPLNPTAAVFYQIGSWIKTQNTIYLEYIWILIVPSTLGGIIGGFFMFKIYEPLLLFIKFKNYDFQNDCEYIQGSVQTTSKES